MGSDSNRFREIVKVLGKYGFGHIIKTRIKKDEAQHDPKDLRIAFEELGPSFIKIGQILSTRSDLLPPEYIAELQKLQESAPSFSFEQASQIFEEANGVSIHEAFAVIGEKPLATASIAQVHKATLHTGESVVVKIQRPKIKEQLIRDLDIFINVIESIPTIFLGVIVDPIAVLQEIRTQSLLEMDFLNEANNMLRFIELHRERPLIQAARPYYTFTTKKTLVQSYIAGIPINKKHELNNEGYNPTEIAEKLVISFLYQVFKDGFYHADPHPGNIYIYEGKIYFLDFGMVGDLTPSVKKFLTDVLQAIILEDIDQLVTLILQICKQNKPVDRVALYRDIENLFNIYLTRGVSGIEIENLFRDVLYFGHKHGLTFPSEIIILEKSIVVLQGVVQHLDPDLDFMKIFKQFFLTGNIVTWDDVLSVESVARTASQFFKNTKDFPIKINDLLDNLNHNRLSIKLSFENIDERLKDVNRVVNRAIFGLILAAMIISSTTIITNAPTAEVSLIGVIFFVSAGIIGIWLLISIIRSSL